MCPLKPLKLVRAIHISLFVLLLLGCSVTGNNPTTPSQSSEFLTSTEFIEIPYEEQLSGETLCKDVTLLPDKTSKVNLRYAKLVFHEGSVREETTISLCTEKSFYALDLEPSGTDFLISADVEFKLKADQFKDDQVQRIIVIIIIAGTPIDKIPHTVEVKGNWVTFRFSIEHFSRYALAIE
jgi:hypothetical protein